MSNMREPVLKAVADVVRDHVGKAFTSLRGRIDGLEATIKALPKPERGEKGETGPQGIRGDMGPAGKDGTNGKDGLNGIAGRDGEQGPEGKQGAKGLDGAAGKDGKDGLTIKGDKGDAAPAVDEDALTAKILAKIPTPVNGKDAPAVDTKALSDEILGAVLKQIPAPIPGKDGRDGNDGESPNANDIVKAVLAQIPPPISGKDGKDAPAVDLKQLADDVEFRITQKMPAPINGRDGKDAPEVDTKALSDAIVEKVLGLIPEPKSGVDGKDGTSVDPEAIRILIAGEVTKAVAALPKPAAGRDGRDGRAGDIGPAGQDAADFDILNGIDESASYQRGVFARHRNGLFRAYRTTDPVVDKNFEAAGWMCINAGIVDIVETLAPDQRTVIKTHEFSDGSIITSQYKSVAMIDRDVWKEGVEYEQGDNVTMAGSIWVCRQTTKDRPGLSKAWRLAVKRGSDGRNLQPKEDDVRSNGRSTGFRIGADR